jgi:hypothetical protein
MTHKLTRALLAAGATSLTALAVAPAAHAGWITGNGNPPVYTTDAPCRNGMGWSYATFDFGTWPPLPQSRTIFAHAVVIDTGAPPTIPPDPALTVSWANTRTIPRRQLVLPSSFTLIGANLYPLDPFGRRRVNHFDYSADFTLTFNRTLPPGTPLRTQWHEPSGTALLGAARYRVAWCWLGTVRSRREIAVSTRDPQLAVAELKPRKWYLDDAGIVIVHDSDLRYELGEPIALKPGGE